MSSQVACEGTPANAVVVDLDDSAACSERRRFAVIAVSNKKTKSTLPVIPRGAGIPASFFAPFSASAVRSDGTSMVE